MAVIEVHGCYPESHLLADFGRFVDLNHFLVIKSYKLTKWVAVRVTCSGRVGDANQYIKYNTEWVEIFAVSVPVGP